MEKYWQIKVEVRHENDRGKIQKTNELYLVKAFTPTDAETKMVEHMGDTSDYSIKAVTQTKILEILK